MTVDELLPRLVAVRRNSRGYMARCPSHYPDKNPSLSISEGDKGILLRCWAGCSLREITQAVGLTVKDLFYAREPDPRFWREQERQRTVERLKRERQALLAGHRCDAQREAERLIAYAREIDISAWSDAKLHSALDRLADAYDLLESERMYE